MEKQPAWSSQTKDKGGIQEVHGIEVPASITTEIKHVQFIRVGWKTTICLLQVGSGFEIIGTSACMDAADYNWEIGEKCAFKKALDKLEVLDGFLQLARKAASV